ncbi:MAG TPA: hypothetical protein VKY22_01285 [Bradyrhizobium sp.]|jgi:hypothetical protein|nr:hypothetical protein [Bradyrhizobium sp.]
MKFVLVNHRTPLSTVTCTECAGLLGTGYLREVSSQRQYCDHDCYLRYQTKSLFMPWLLAERDAQLPGRWSSAAWPATPYIASHAFVAAFAAAACWYSISFAKAALRVSELVATESFGPFSGRG